MVRWKILGHQQTLGYTLIDRKLGDCLTFQIDTAGYQLDYNDHVLISKPSQNTPIVTYASIEYFKLFKDVVNPTTFELFGNMMKSVDKLNEMSDEQKTLYVTKHFGGDNRTKEIVKLKSIANQRD